MAEIKKQFVDGPEEGKADAKVIAQFDETLEDENGNLKAVGRDSNAPKGEAKVVKQFADTVEDENGNLRAESAPGM